MTQPPQRGQTAPRSTDLGPNGLSQTHEPNGWGAGFGQEPATADTPTGTLPSLPRESIQAPSSESSGAPARDRSARARVRGPRRARLQLRHIDPWTVLKFSCVLSIALFFVWMIVVGVLFGILDGAGIIGKINHVITLINTGEQPPVRASIVFGGAAIIGVVDVVLFIALSTIGSLVYNLCADLVGGVEVTLSER